VAGWGRRRSNGESSDPLMVPSSPHELHAQSIGAGRSARNTLMRPGHGRCAGRRRHPNAVVHTSPAGPTVAACTTKPRCSPMRRAGPGASSGMSKKWRRSDTNTSPEGSGTARPSPTSPRRPGARLWRSAGAAVPDRAGPSGSSRHLYHGTGRVTGPMAVLCQGRTGRRRAIAPTYAGGSLRAGQCSSSPPGSRRCCR